MKLSDRGELQMSRRGCPGSPKTVVYNRACYSYTTMLFTMSVPIRPTHEWFLLAISGYSAEMSHWRKYEENVSGLWIAKRY